MDEHRESRLKISIFQPGRGPRSKLPSRSNFLAANVMVGRILFSEYWWLISLGAITATLSTLVAELGSNFETQVPLLMSCWWRPTTVIRLVATVTNVITASNTATTERVIGKSPRSVGDSFVDWAILRSPRDPVEWCYAQEWTLSCGRGTSTKGRR